MKRYVARYELKNRWEVNKAEKGGMLFCSVGAEWKLFFISTTEEGREKEEAATRYSRNETGK